MLKVQGQRVIDSGGGFLIEENNELEQQMVYNTYLHNYIYNIVAIMHYAIIHVYLFS